PNYAEFVPGITLGTDINNLKVKSYVNIGKQAFYEHFTDEQRKQFVVLTTSPLYVRATFSPWTVLQSKVAKVNFYIRELEDAHLHKASKSLCLQIPLIQRVNRLIGELDLLHGLGEFATRVPSGRPSFDSPGVLELPNAFHLPLYAATKKRRTEVVPNSFRLGPDAPVMIVTGPNMGGKTCALRLVGSAAVLAQSGVNVPMMPTADSTNAAPPVLRMPIVDAIHTRFGSTDDVSQDQSMFMLEMRELNEILRRTTPRSLLLLDELGRGTSEVDGAALVGAVVRHVLRSQGALAMISTHFRDLDVALAAILEPEELQRVTFVHSQCRGGGVDQELVLDYRLAPGLATESYGIDIASAA
ncbi:muts domain V-domain-containing protein, partial [Blastocladiella britannica]